MRTVLRSAEDAFGHPLSDLLAGRRGVEVVERDDGCVFTGVPDDCLAPFRASWSQKRRTMRFVRGRVLDVSCGAKKRRNQGKTNARSRVWLASAECSEGSRKMRNRKRNWIRSWILKRAVLGFAVAALVVPAAAQARVDEGVGGQSAAVTRLVGSHQQPALPCAPNCARKEVQVKGSDYELLEKNRGEPSTVATPQLVSSPGFDWGDAGIGAGVAIGLVLLGGAAVSAGRHLGKPQTA
jgi:hypothetical protein